MLYAVLCYHDEAEVESWSAEQDQAVVAKRGAVAKDRLRPEQMGPVLRLVPTTGATTIRSSASGELVLDGPFAETKEQLLGLYVVECDALEEAIELAREMKRGEGGAFEVRPLRVFRQGMLPTDKEIG